MKSNRTLKLIHFCGTGWFVVCASFLLILAMRQAGAAWWLIFSLSGYSVIFAFVLTSIYLFAVFRGVVRSQTEQEYPLTASVYYMTFYDFCPFIGAIAGIFAVIGIGPLMEQLATIAAGTLGTTFLVWIIVDPVAGLIEMLMPTSRKLREERVSNAKAEKLARELESNEILAGLGEKERMTRQQWQPILQPMAETLAKLMSSNETDFGQRESKVVEIGANAWHLGGIACMNRLHEMALAEHLTKYDHKYAVDYNLIWWDGVGTWRKPILSNILTS